MLKYLNSKGEVQWRTMGKAVEDDSSSNRATEFPDII